MGDSSESTSRPLPTRKLITEYAVVLPPPNAGELSRQRPKPERSSSMRRTRSSSSRPRVPKSLRKVSRLTSLMEALVPWDVGTVCTTRS